MKDFVRVVDLEESGVPSVDYDLAIFASGYERRATYVAQRLQIRSRQSLVLGFRDALQNRQRTINDTYFTDHVAEPRLVGAVDDQEVLAQLRTIDGLDGAIQRIFVDYSSMSKIWYAAILSWARYLPDGAVSIDFGYATGRPTIPYRHSAIRSIEAIPGFEATTGSDAGVLVLGLGFDRFMTASVVDQMEPDKVVVFLADPSTDPKYVAYAKRVHASVLGQTVDADDVVAMPLLSVEESFRLLAEVVLPYTDRARVTIVPLGPKTHVLAALLVSMRFPHVGCLRVSTATTTRRSEPTHEISIARVFLDSPV